MNALWYVGHGGSRRNYENTISEFLSWMCSLAMNAKANFLNSVLRKSIFNTPIFVLINEICLLSDKIGWLHFLLSNYMGFFLHYHISIILKVLTGDCIFVKLLV